MLRQSINSALNALLHLCQVATNLLKRSLNITGSLTNISIEHLCLHVTFGEDCSDAVLGALNLLGDITFLTVGGLLCEMHKFLDVLHLLE